LNKIKTTDFFDQEYVNFASYDNLRKIASLVDGFKNSSRKIACTILDKNITKMVKVSRLDSTFAEYTEYLHGSACTVIVGMAQNFPGSNNLPLLSREGNFGSRFIKEASAPRYIYTNGSDEMFKLFNKTDSKILKKQFFEGVEIEPVHYVPSLPLILINGAQSPSVGFAQKILGRSPEEIKKIIKTYLKTGKIQPVPAPYYKGFNGVIEQGENSKQWLIKGTFKKISLTKLEITEVPVGYDLKGYIKVLDDLEDKGIIKSYKDCSENDTFNFIVSVDSKFLTATDDQILDKLKLTKKISENFTCIDENNKIVQYTSADEILEHYIRVKSDYMTKRKNYMLDNMHSDILLDISRYSFIKNITENKIIISKRTKSDIVQQLEAFKEIIQNDGTYDYLLRMPVYSLTEEKMQELLDKIKKTKEALEVLKNTSEKELWLQEI
jgi:DNA gyrase/topoisomerase IV subunit A